MMKISCILAVFLACCFIGSNGLSFTNQKCNGAACQFQIQSLSFTGYNLNVNGLNTKATSITGGSVSLSVQTQFWGFWVDAYDATDPTCSYVGTNCVDGTLVGASATKSFTLTMTSTPPSGTYKGQAVFFNTVGGVTTNYADVTMSWNCDGSKCY